MSEKQQKKIKDMTREERATCAFRLLAASGTPSNPNNFCARRKINSSLTGLQSIRGVTVNLLAQ